MTGRIPRTLPRSIVTSLITTALDFGVLTGAVELLHVHYVLATWLGTVVGSLAGLAGLLVAASRPKPFGGRGNLMACARPTASSSSWLRRRSSHPSIRS